MEKELRNWIGTLGAMAIIGALTLGTLPVLAKGQKAGSRPSIIVSEKLERRIAAAHAKKTESRPSASQSKKSGSQDTASQDRKAHKNGTSKSKPSDGTKVNINTATADELVKLPRVGAKAAQRISGVPLGPQDFQKRGRTAEREGDRAQSPRRHPPLRDAVDER